MLPLFGRNRVGDRDLLGPSFHSSSQPACQGVRNAARLKQIKTTRCTHGVCWNPVRHRRGLVARTVELAVMGRCRFATSGAPSSHPATTCCRRRSDEAYQAATLHLQPVARVEAQQPAPAKHGRRLSKLSRAAYQTFRKHDKADHQIQRRKLLKATEALHPCLSVVTQHHGDGPLLVSIASLRRFIVLQTHCLRAPYIL